MNADLRFRHEPGDGGRDDIRVGGLGEPGSAAGDDGGERNGVGAAGEYEIRESSSGT